MNDFNADVKYLDDRVIDSLRRILGDSRNKKHIKNIGDFEIKPPTSYPSPFSYVYSIEYMEQLLNRLNKIDAYVLRQKAIGLTNRAIAKKLSVDETRIGYRVRRIRGKI